jgi:hypothetical protein
MFGDEVLNVAFTLDVLIGDPDLLIKVCNETTVECLYTKKD